jgi:hypothetical protein
VGVGGSVGALLPVGVLPSSENKRAPDLVFHSVFLGSAAYPAWAAAWSGLLPTACPDVGHGSE